MALISINQFAGMMPVKNPRGVADPVATVARDVRVNSGSLRGTNKHRFIKSLAPTTKRAFRVPFNSSGDPVPLQDLDNCFWKEFSDPDTNFVRSPIINDSYERYYWCSPSTGFRYASKNELVSGSNGKAVIVPSPTTAALLYAVTDAGATGRVVTRAYAFTWINQFGEESQPSPPVEATGKTDEDWLLTSIEQPLYDPDQVPVTSIRIYRTITGTSGGTEFYKVADILVGEVAYLDSISDTVVSQQALLDSTVWASPPDMDGIAAMPNGIFVGFKGSTLYFSENYRPHAWPAEYAITVQHPIVGLDVFGNSCAVLTTGAPAVVTGVKAAAMSLIQSSTPAPCLSRRGIVSTLDAVFFPTETGLAIISGSGMKVISTGFIDAEQWRADYAPTAQRSMFFNGELVIIRDEGDAVSFGLPLGQEVSGLGGVVEHTTLVAPKSVDVDPFSGRATLIDDGKLYEWADPDEGSNSFVWQSKEFYRGKPVAMTVLQIMYTTPPGVTPGVTANVIADGVDLGALTVPSSGALVRVPGNTKADFWKIKVSANVDISAIALAGSPAELRNA